MSRVMIVDDEPQFGAYLHDWLLQDGHEVKAFTRAEEAIDFGTRWQPNVLVADWMLRSTWDGLQVSAAMRAVNPELQTILITGYPSLDLKARAQAAEVFSFIEKPFTLAEVAGAVRLAANVGRAPLPGHILIVSESPIISQLSSVTLHAAGYESRVAASAADALFVMHEDPDVTIVLLDCMTPSIDLGILAEELRQLRPDLIVIGSSDGDDAAQFAELGIDRFLPRFWDPDDLHALLIVPIKACSGCGSPLPLRRLLPGDAVRSWECICGARYEAVLLENSPAVALERVRAIS